MRPSLSLKPAGESRRRHRLFLAGAVLAAAGSTGCGTTAEPDLIRVGDHHLPREVAEEFVRFEAEQSAEAGGRSAEGSAPGTASQTELRRLAGSVAALWIIGDELDAMAPAVEVDEAQITKDLKALNGFSSLSADARNLVMDLQKGSAKMRAVYQDSQVPATAGAVFARRHPDVFQVICFDRVTVAPKQKRVVEKAVRAGTVAKLSGFEAEVCLSATALRSGAQPGVPEAVTSAPLGRWSGPHRSGADLVWVRPSGSKRLTGTSLTTESDALVQRPDVIVSLLAAQPDFLWIAPALGDRLAFDDQGPVIVSSTEQDAPTVPTTVLPVPVGAGEGPDVTLPPEVTAGDTVPADEGTAGASPTEPTTGG